jgi:hypothetical protein
MKNLITFTALFVFAAFTVNAQNAIIEVTIDSETTASKKLTSGGQVKTSLNDLDLSDGNGKLVVINKTTKDAVVRFIDLNANNVFRIPASAIGKKTTAADPDVRKDFVIDNSGNITGVPGGQIKKELGFIVDIEGKPQAATLPGVRVSEGAGTTTMPGILEADMSAQLLIYVKKEIEKRGYKYLGGQHNLIIDREGIIHIYLDEFGHPIYTGFPVVAKENYDKFQIHVISTVDKSFFIASTGEFRTIELKDEVPTGLAKTQSGAPAIEIHQVSSSIFGPYTGLFPFTIHMKPKGGSPTLILDKSIKLLKTSRVSVNTGAVATWLRSPENIETFIMPNGDTTLVSDDPSVRGYLALMLTFHLKPRNLNIQPRDIIERFGISVGTNLSSKAFDNFFLGISIEITNGLFINGGGHFGRVNHIVNYKENFKYGEEKFSGTLLTKKKWDVGPYVAINIDAGLFGKVFKSILGTGNND